MVTVLELHDLVGEEVSSICFVRDYVEIHFDGPILRCFAGPICSMRGVTLEFPQPGSRDTLCMFIGREVTSAIDQVDDLTLSFADSDQLAVPKRSRAAGPEIAHLVPCLDGKIAVDRTIFWNNLDSS